MREASGWGAVGWLEEIRWVAGRWGGVRGTDTGFILRILGILSGGLPPDPTGSVLWPNPI